MSNENEPTFTGVPSNSDEYQLTIKKARSTLNEFKEILLTIPDSSFACLKFFLPQEPESKNGAFIWLMNPQFEDGFCYATLFELPEEFEWIEVGQLLKLDENELIDWYILSDTGELRGGYSLRYQRSKLPKDKQNDYDNYIGVKTYL